MLRLVIRPSNRNAAIGGPQLKVITGMATSMEAPVSPPTAAGSVDIGLIQRMSWSQRHFVVRPSNTTLLSCTFGRSTLRGMGPVEPVSAPCGWSCVRGVIWPVRLIWISSGLKSNGTIPMASSGLTQTRNAGTRIPATALRTEFTPLATAPATLEAAPTAAPATPVTEPIAPAAAPAPAPMAPAAVLPPPVIPAAMLICSPPRSLRPLARRYGPAATGGFVGAPAMLIRCRLAVLIGCPRSAWPSSYACRSQEPLVDEDELLHGHAEGHRVQVGAGPALRKHVAQRPARHRVLVRVQQLDLRGAAVAAVRRGRPVLRAVAQPALHHRGVLRAHRPRQAHLGVLDPPGHHGLVLVVATLRLERRVEVDPQPGAAGPATQVHSVDADLEPGGQAQHRLNAHHGYSSTVGAAVGRQAVSELAVVLEEPLVDELEGLDRHGAAAGVEGGDGPLRRHRVLQLPGEHLGRRRVHQRDGHDDPELVFERRRVQPGADLVRVVLGRATLQLDVGVLGVGREVPPMVAHVADPEVRDVPRDVEAVHLVPTAQVVVARHHGGLEPVREADLRGDSQCHRLPPSGSR